MANRQRLLERQRAYSLANREQEAERARLWRAENPDRMRELNQSYYAANRERLVRHALEWQQQHPEQVRARNRKRKAMLRGAAGEVTAGDWAEILDRFDHKCAYCGAEQRLTQDHVVPIVRGGAHEPENVVPACMSCNSSKGPRLPEEWLPGKFGVAA